jgi:hypothetical protein
LVLKNEKNAFILKINYYLLRYHLHSGRTRRGKRDFEAELASKNKLEPINELTRACGFFGGGIRA